MIWPFNKRPDLSEYVGTVYTCTDVENSKGKIETHHARWILKIDKRGKRRATLVGNPLNSPFAVDRETRVRAWMSGGPLPKLDAETANTPEKPSGKIILMIDNDKGGSL